MKNQVWKALAILSLLTACSGCGQNKFQQEVVTEEAAVKLVREFATGDYGIITTAELKELLDGDNNLLVVDTMPYDGSYAKAHIPGAVHFLFPKDPVEEWDDAEMDGKSQDDFERLLGDDKDRLIVVYCGYVKCARSHNGAYFARQLGYTNVKRHPGGIFAWKGAGYPTEAAK
jgi:rhodanese-related sulfurtransferase